MPEPDLTNVKPMRTLIYGSLALGRTTVQTSSFPILEMREPHKMEHCAPAAVSITSRFRSACAASHAPASSLEARISASASSPSPLRTFCSTAQKDRVPEQ